MSTTDAFKIIRRPTHIRWMIRIDMPAVLSIEHGSFDFPRCEEEFLRALRRRNCIGMVAERGASIAGFMVYELNRGSIDVLNFAVHPAFRREGVGAQMAAKLVGKLSPDRRTRLTIDVRETNLTAQQFFRVQGFRATRVIREHFRDTGEDAYVMTYTLDDATAGRRIACEIGGKADA